MDLVARYLRRIGDPPRDLASIVAAHVRHLPFENLDPLADRPVRLDLPSLADKLLDQGRGGYCFEHNGLLMAVLRDLGWRVTGFGARVRWGVPEDQPMPRTHMTLRVDGAGGPWLVDVGFGGNSLTAPIPLAPGEARTPMGPVRLDRDAAGWWTLSAVIAGEARPLYRFDETEHLPVDYALANFWTSCHPDSHFKAGLRIAIVGEDRRYGLRDVELTETFPDGRVERRELGSEAEVRGVLRDVFRIRIPADPRVDEAIRRTT